MKKADFKKYKAVILAGGKGTRLYPVTKETPKPLLCVGKKPIINYLVELFNKQGIKEVAVLISEEFREDFEWWKKRYYPSASSGQVPSSSLDKSRDSSGQAPKITFFEEKKPMGTFGGLWFLKEWIGKNNFFLTNGDELKKINLSKIADFYEKTNPIGTIALIKVDNPQDYGVVVCEAGGIVKDFLEKPKNPPSRYINSGLYLFSPKIFDYHPGPKFLMIEKDIFPKLAAEGKLTGFQFNGKWADCGTWERYSKAIEEWGQ